MLIKLVPQRSSKAAVLLPLVVLVLLLTTAKLRHGPQLLPSSLFDSSKPSDTTQDGDSRVKLQNSEASEHSPIIRPQLDASQCSPELEFLRRADLGLNDNIVYSRRCIRPVIDSQYDRDAVSTVSEPLISHATSVNLTSCFHADPIPCDTLLLHVPPAYPQNTYESIIFGVASTYSRLEASLPAFSHWLSGTGAQLVGVVADADDPGKNYDLTALEEKYRAQGVTASMMAPILQKKGNDHSDIPVEKHHFMLIRSLVGAVTPSTKWLGILDDDTFFPSLYPLAEELQKYDHTESLWLGALTDNFGSLKLWGYMAYGGAGVFLSLPLAQQLEPVLEECMDQATVDTGDGYLRDCIYFHTHTRLTQVPGLYQHDIHGDMSGFFESGVRPLSVHHWKSWYDVPMIDMAAVTAVCGDCFLGRYRFADDTLLANGYSITSYPQGLDTIDLGKMETTWQSSGHEYDFSFGPLRDRLSSGQKKSHRLLDARVTDTGAFRQIYVYRSDKGNSQPNEVVELLWETA